MGAIHTCRCWKNVGIILLYAHIKNTSFHFLMNVFLGVDSKSGIHFFRLALENPDNPEKSIFPDYRSFPVSEEKYRLQNWILQVNKPFIIMSR